MVPVRESAATASGRVPTGMVAVALAADASPAVATEIETKIAARWVNLMMSCLSLIVDTVVSSDVAGLGLVPVGPWGSLEQSEDQEGDCAQVRHECEEYPPRGPAGVVETADEE